jgi:hypothetical protein
MPRPWTPHAAVLGPRWPRHAPVEANAGAFFAQASIYSELSPEGVAAVAWDTVVYDRDLGDLPVWLVGPRTTSDDTDIALPARSAGRRRRQGAAHVPLLRRHARALPRHVDPLAARRCAQGLGPQLRLRIPDWTIAVMRPPSAAHRRSSTHDRADPAHRISDPRRSPSATGPSSAMHCPCPPRWPASRCQMPCCSANRPPTTSAATTMPRSCCNEAEQIDAGTLSAQERATLALIQRELSGLRAQHAVDSWRRPWLFPAGPDFTAMFWANSTSVGDAAAAALYVDRLAGLPGYLRDVHQHRGRPRAWLPLSPGGAAERGGQHAGHPGRPARSLGLAVAVQALAGCAQPAVLAQADRALGCGSRGPDAGSAGLGRLPGRPGGARRARIAQLRGRPGRRRVLPHLGAALHQHHRRRRRSARAGPGRSGAASARDGGRRGRDAGFAATCRTTATSSRPTRSSSRHRRDALRTSVEALCKRVDRRIPEFFGLIPRITYGVQSIPEAVSARMPPAYAQPSPADGSTAGIFWISGLPSKAPSYLHPASSCTRPGLGHLMHLALLNEQTALPAFRRYGAVKYTACVEGWALYCEIAGRRDGRVRHAARTLRPTRARRCGAPCAWWSTPASTGTAGAASRR